MPGELGDEQESQNVGYYEKRYQPSDEWMTSKVESVPTEHEESINQDQVNRILKNMRKSFFKS